MTNRPIVYETSKHYIVRHPRKGFEIYRNEDVAAVKCATIGYDGQIGLDKAKAEIIRRESV